MDEQETDVVAVQTRRGTFIREVFSDDGAPSSSRILTFILSLASLGIVVGVMYHVCHIVDASTLGLWLTALPSIIMALIGLSAAPYAINRGTGSISDVINSLKR